MKRILKEIAEQYHMLFVCYVRMGEFSGVNPEEYEKARELATTTEHKIVELKAEVFL